MCNSSAILNLFLAPGSFILKFVLKKKKNPLKGVKQRQIINAEIVCNNQTTVKFPASVTHQDILFVSSVL